MSTKRSEGVKLVCTLPNLVQDTSWCCKASLIRHLNNVLTMIEMNKDKKMAERILNHALQIIYLLTGEEYTIVKKNSPHSSIDQLSEECDIVVHKKVTDESHETLSILGISANRNLGLQDENVDTVGEERECEINEKDILQVTIHSDLLASLHDDNLYPVSINEEGQYEREEKTIKQFEIHSDKSADNKKVKLSCFSKHKRDVGTDVRDYQQFEENSAIIVNKDNETVKLSRVSKHKRDVETDVRDYPQVKEENSAVTVNKDGCLSRRLVDDPIAEYSAKSTVQCASSLSRKIKGENSKHSTMKESMLCERGNITSTLEYSEYKPNEDTTNCATLGDRIVACEGHQLQHTGQKHNINREDFSFNSLLLDEQHKTKKNTTEKVFVCPDCGKCFTKKSQLSQHYKIHTGEKPYACSSCDKCFNRRSHLVTHQRTHTGEKPYVCPVCSKGFSIMSNLVKHRRTHTGEKPYICPDCGKGFSEGSNLGKHRRSHSRHKPWGFRKLESASLKE